MPAQLQALLMPDMQPECFNGTCSTPPAAVRAARTVPALQYMSPRCQVSAVSGSWLSTCVQPAACESSVMAATCHSCTCSQLCCTSARLSPEPWALHLS